MSAVQNDTLKINHCVNRAAPVSIYRDWPASLPYINKISFSKKYKTSKFYDPAYLVSLVSMFWIGAGSESVSCDQFMISLTLWLI